VPRQVDHDERRHELAAAAARVIARSGVAGATLREVAAEAGWTTGALTHHFTDKRELLRFTLETSLEGRWARRQRRRSMTPDEALRSTLVDALPIDEASLLHWSVTVAFCAQASGDPELAVTQRDAYREFRDDVTSLVQASGRGDGPEAVREAERLIALLDGVALQALFDPATWPATRQIAVIDDALRRAPQQV
jgi:AcrR family transcriptional regulator